MSLLFLLSLKKKDNTSIPRENTLLFVLNGKKIDVLQQ